MESPKFPEALLHYIWKFRYFDHYELVTEEGIPVKILKTGIHNHFSGPDFTEAQIQIGDKIWTGAVEIHKKSSDWQAHGHQHDKAYEHVVLHVVYENNRAICYSNGELIPTVVLKNRIAPQLFDRSAALLLSSDRIPCAAQLPQVPEPRLRFWLERLAIERLEMRTHALQEALQASQQDWAQCFYRALARNFGMPVNATGFEQLSAATPLKVLKKHKHQLFALEALLFGQAGLLQGPFEQDYPQRLQAEYEFLAHKYELQAINPVVWRYGKIRPAAYPSLRIALFALLIHQSHKLFSQLLSSTSLKSMQAHFKLQLSGYWLKHYRFEDQTKARNQKSLGRSAFHNIAINTLIPFLFLYGKVQQENSYCERALIWLEQLPAERNRHIQQWRQIGLAPENAKDTQALLQLQQRYCEQKYCLNCAIGHKILKG